MIIFKVVPAYMTGLNRLNRVRFVHNSVTRHININAHNLYLYLLTEYVTVVFYITVNVLKLYVFIKFQHQNQED